MTAPFAPPPSATVKWVLLGMLIVALALPFGRREDWLGWLALVSVSAVAMGLWAVLLRSLARTIGAWRRGKEAE